MVKWLKVGEAEEEIMAFVKREGTHSIKECTTHH